MQTGDRPPFELVELAPAGVTPDGRGLDQIEVGRADRARLLDGQRLRWSRLPVLDRRLMTAGVLAFALAAVAGVGTVRARAHVVRTTHTTVLRAAVPRIDALGCPLGRRCALITFPAAVVAAAHDALPRATVVEASQTLDETSGQRYRVSLLLTAPQTVVRAESTCVPGAGAVVGSALRVRQILRTEIRTRSRDRPTPAGPKWWSIILPSSRPGMTGCGIDVEAQSNLTAGVQGRQIDTIVNLLADDPRLMA